MAPFPSLPPFPHSKPPLPPPLLLPAAPLLPFPISKPALGFVGLLLGCWTLACPWAAPLKVIKAATISVFFMCSLRSG